MGDFKLEGGGGELFKKGFRKLLSQEWNYFEKQMIRNSVCLNTNQKQHHQKKTIGCLYQFANIKTEIKEIKDRENAHRYLYWFTLNPELHPVFSKTTEEFH